MSVENPNQKTNDSGSDEEKLPDGWSEEMKEAHRKGEESRKRFMIPKVHHQVFSILQKIWVFL